MCSDDINKLRELRTGLDELELREAEAPVFDMGVAEERALLDGAVAVSEVPVWRCSRKACRSAGHSKCTQWNTSLAVFFVPVMRTNTTTRGSLKGITCQDLRAPRHTIT